MLGACETQAVRACRHRLEGARAKPTTISPIAFEAVQKFDAIFMLERSINGLSPAERVAARLEASASARQRMPVAPLGDQVNEARPEPSHATRHSLRRRAVLWALSQPQGDANGTGVCRVLRGAKKSARRSSVTSAMSCCYTIPCFCRTNRSGSRHHACARRSLALGASHNRRWLVLPALVTAFLFQHAVQGWCSPVPILRRLGFRAVWTQPTPLRRHCSTVSVSSCPNACALQNTSGQRSLPPEHSNSTKM